MSTIEVTCNCGRVYVLPGDKEGRKLQCRRCGAVIAIRRDAEPGVVVPFQTPIDDEDEGTKADSPPRGRGAVQGPLDLKPLPGAPPPLRRCPRCGLRDDPGVAVCVRCGTDLREPVAPAAPKPAAKPLGARGSTAKIVKADLPKAQKAQDERVSRIETFAKVSFVPLAGIVASLMALGLSTVGNAGLRELPAPSRKALDSRLVAARLMAVSTLLMWCGVIGFYVFIYRPQQRHEIHENLALGCRNHLDSLGRWIRAARPDDARFPADGKKTLADAIRELAEQHELGDAVLSCPVLGGERYAIDGGLAALDAGTNPEYLIVWDAVPHTDPDGSLRWFALRADGAVEEFRNAQQFERGRARSSVRAVLPGPTPPDIVGPPGQGGPTTKAPRPKNETSEGFEPRRAALIALGAELDKSDPDLQKTLPEADFTKRIGLAPGEAVVQVVRYGDDDLRHVAARLVARLEIPGPELLRLAEQLSADADGETRLTLVLGLRRAGAPAWLDACAGLATEALPPISDRALALIATEAQTGREGLRRVLLRARDKRQLSKTASDQPIFALPPDIYQTCSELLDDHEVGAEALAVLSRGGPEVEKVLDPLFASTDAHTRELAFRALRSSLVWRDAPRAPLHERFKAETDRSVKAAVLPLFLDTIDVETVRRALESLRESPSDALGVIARRALAGAKDKDALAEMIRELDRGATSRDEVLSELRKPSRVVDATVSEVLYQKGPLLEGAGQEAAVALAFGRIDDASHRFILKIATQSTVPSAREAAWKALIDGSRLSDKVRGEVIDEICARLAKEPETSVKAQIFPLLARYEYRTPPTVAALESLAKRSSETADMRERAVLALSQSTDPRSVTSLVDVVDSLTGHPKYIATLKLRELTNAAQQPLTSVEWRRIVHQVETDVKRKLKERDEKDRVEFRDRQEQAEARARDLRPRTP